MGAREPAPRNVLARSDPEFPESNDLLLAPV